ncbi:CpsD/CapB family tyrosine-protein kinase [Clostridium pasteurianum]|uniref:CpsD/CapB family tyrosine-protein kinase n=1 Tax=Clostridium pasteurianum TaxID=1501 RepID=UPI002260A7A5|nr:CpsD/CapB family tyrosine-protein kinase [Clostridium pasteurianum]UZW14936.1 CpsD/CapB family tyrosine-protein kinase [Clostridium pasteurianum]
MKKCKNNIIEGYRRLLNIIEGYKSNDIRCISVTSNSDMEGKAIIAKNIAVILAKSGEKILFIDCNLSLCKSEKFKKNNIVQEKGLINILKYIDSENTNAWKLKSYIEDTQFKGLSILKLGTNNLNDYFSIFKIEYLKIIMDELKKNFNYIILDIPSFENLSYAQILSSASDGCLFVLKEGVNEISEVRTIKDNLNKIGCKVLGCIFNKEKISTELFNDSTGGKDHVVCLENN